MVGSFGRLWCATRTYSNGTFNKLNHFFDWGVCNEYCTNIQANRYYVTRNCDEWHKGDLVYLDIETNLHSVRCCNHEGDICYSHIRNTSKDIEGTDQHCLYNQSFANAKRLCEASGLRLCTLQEVRRIPNHPTTEQNWRKPGRSVCCTTGCYHDEQTVWTSSKENDDYYPNLDNKGGRCIISGPTAKVLCGETEVKTWNQQSKTPALVLSFIIIIVVIIGGVSCYLNNERQKKRRVKIKLKEQSQKIVELSSPSGLRKTLAQSTLDEISLDFDPKLDFKDQLKDMPYNTKREIHRDCFNIDFQIGSGNFGKVYKGTVKGLYDDTSTTIVAIKVNHGNGAEGELKDFLDEIKLMSYIKAHPNLVSMIGSCSSDLTQDRKLWLVIEFCEHGDLKTYLVRNKEKLLCGEGNDGMDSRFLLKWSCDIARGMEYLENNRIMHGDLAARNVLVADNILIDNCPIAKVADFGLAKNFYGNVKYEKTSRLLVPWRWMAIEYLKDDFFTLRSDVWSYGVTLWEILSFGRTPYGRQEYDEVFRKLESGYQLSFPDECHGITSWSPEQMYKEISGGCFVMNPDIRQSFSDIVKALEAHLTTEEKMICSRTNEMYQKMRAAKYLKFGNK